MFSQVLLREPLLSIISLLLAILWPVLLLLLSPVYITRLLVQKLAKVYKPELSEMLFGYSSLLASMQKDPHCCGNFGFAIKNTKLNLPKVYKIAEELLKMPKYRKAKQTVDQWMGFYWWKDCPSFRLENQIIVHSERITSAQFDAIRDDSFIAHAFKKGKPLWELHIFENFINENGDGTPEIMVGFPSHHALLDWFSGVELAQEISKMLGISLEKTKDINLISNNNGAVINDKKIVKEDEEGFKRPAKKSIGITASSLGFYFYILKLFLWGPFSFFRTLIFSVTSSIGNYVEGETTKEYFTMETVLELDYVRGIAAKNGVKTTAVTFGALSGALRELLLDLGVNPIPKSVSVAGPVPLPWKRPPGLNNHFVGIPIQAPVGEEDAFKRLKMVDERFDSLKYSTTLVGFHAFFSGIGSLFHWMIKSVSTSPTRAASFSMAPGPSNLNEILGMDISRFIGNGGMPYGDVVLLGFYSLSVNRKLTIRIKGDKLLFPTQINANRFIKNFLRQLQIFDKCNAFS